MDFDEKTMRSEKIYEGRMLNLRIDTVELADKKYSKREIIEHPGGVAIVPILDNNDIVMVRQYRKAVEDTVLEIPAGKLEVNEEPRETAIRELNEETGYEAGKVSYLTEFFPSPGYTDEKIYIFLAEDLKEVEQVKVEGEYIEKVILPLEDLMKMVRLGEIVDGKTIIGLHAVSEFLNMEF